MRFIAVLVKHALSLFQKLLEINRHILALKIESNNYRISLHNLFKKTYRRLQKSAMFRALKRSVSYMEKGLKYLKMCWGIQI